jgi:hypothetical protein
MVQRQPYDQNGHVKVTHKTFCKEPYINQFLCHWNVKFHKFQILLINIHFVVDVATKNGCARKSNAPSSIQLQQKWLD